MARALALLLLLCACPAAWAQGVDAWSSILLVAKKGMRDPFFRDSVVLVTHRAGPNPMGLILNRRTAMPVANALPEAASRSRQEVVFFGGPVDVEGLVVVFRASDPPKDVVEVLDGVYLTGRREAIVEVLARNLPPGDIRVFSGHAGWARGQLEAEVARGDWHLARADAGAVFAADPEALWRELERKAAAKPAASRPPQASAPPLGQRHREHAQHHEE